MSAPEKIERSPTNTPSEQPVRQHVARQIRPLHILIVSALLSALLWNKLAPFAPIPFLPKELPEGFENCHSEYFANIPALAGTARLTITANPVVESTDRHPGVAWTGKTPYFRPETSDLSFCSVTYSYTHVGYDNQVNVTTWLPRPSAWNGRFQGVGGGGYVAGLGSIALRPAVATGWAAASTDAGLFGLGDPRGADMSFWALTSGGNINWNMLHLFGIRAIEDMTLIGQAITKQYYNKTTSSDRLRSYWNGCSTGGRQGLMLAQRAPHLYDGILATAPALDYSPLLLGMSHAQQLMTSNNIFPQPCELSHIHAAAIAACDPLDGVTDGLISSPELCKFDSLALINSTIPCPDAPGGTTKLTPFAAHLVHEIWRGPRLPTAPDIPLHPGLPPESSLSALAATSCNYTSSNPNDSPPRCTGIPSGLTTSFLNVLMHLNRDSDLLPQPQPGPPGSPQASPTFPNLTTTQYHALLPLGLRDLSPLISATDPNLSRFATGPKQPKMITWHGLADELIAAQHSLDYYRAVLEHFETHSAEYSLPSSSSSFSSSFSFSPVNVADEQTKTKGDVGGGGIGGGIGGGGGSDPVRSAQNRTQIAKVQDFYRYYQVPSVQHCGKGPGPYPGMFLDSRGALDHLVAWVERGIVPEVLMGVSEVRDDLLAGQKRQRRQQEQKEQQPQQQQQQHEDGDGDDWDGRLRRPLCAWPNRAIWRGDGRGGKEGKWWEAEGWACERMAV